MTEPPPHQLSTTQARLEQMPFSNWHIRLLALLGGAHLLDAFDATSIAFVLPVLIGLWHLNPVHIGVLIAAGYLGQAIGAIGFGLLAGRIGRIRTLRATLFLLGIFSLACAFASGYVVLVALRVVQGIGLGGELPVAATYMNEVCPSRFRGRMVVAIQLLFGVGTLVSPLMALILIPHFGWRSMFAIGALPIVLAIILPRALPESPLWLTSKNRVAECDRAVGIIEASVYGKHQAPIVPQFTGPDAQPEGSIGKGSMRDILKAPHLRPTMSVWLVAICASIVGYGIIGWMPSIFRIVYHLPIRTVLAFSVGTAVLGLMGISSSIFFIDRVGRKLAISAGFSGAAIFMAILTYFGNKIQPFDAMLLSGLSMASLSLPLSGLYAYATELYPPRSKALGVGVASAWVRVASIFAPLIIGVILSIGSVSGVYVFFCGAAAVGALSMHCLGVETGPRSLGIGLNEA
jgi:putative MFS transporter